MKKKINYTTPTIANVGVMDIKGGSNHILYDRWVGMICKCYDEKDEYYNSYGLKGVYVDKRWHTFSNYVYDIERKENYDKLCQNPRMWHIDKDTLCGDTKYYSNETTLILSATDNSKECSSRSGRPKRVVMQFDKIGNFIKEYESATDASKQTGVAQGNISSCCRGEQKTSGGYVWKYKY